MRFRSVSETGIISSYSRAARFDRLRRRWLLPCRVRTSFPEPVYSNRRAAALWVFNFGIQRSDRRVYHTPIQPQTQHQPSVAEPERAGVGHLGVTVLADTERDRDFGNPEAGSIGPGGALELNAETVFLERDGSEHRGARGAETA